MLLAIPLALSAAENLPDAVTFESHVRPILKAHCWQCHGEEERVKGGLDARLARSLLKGGDSGPALVAGKHAESLMYERVAAGEMPPGKKKLAPRELEILARWIDQGAATTRAEPETLAAGDTFTDEERTALMPFHANSCSTATTSEASRMRNLSAHPSTRSCCRGCNRKISHMAPRPTVPRSSAGSPMTSPACPQRPRLSTGLRRTSRPALTNGWSMNSWLRPLTVNDGAGTGSMPGRIHADS